MIERNSKRKNLRLIAPDKDEGWNGRPGQLWQAFISNFAKYWRSLNIKEKAEKAPELLWNRAQGEADEKYSKSRVNFAEEIEKEIANDLSLATFADSVRVAKAAADKAIFEAQLSEVQLLQSRLDLVERLQKTGLIPIWIGKHVEFKKVPPDFSWDDVRRDLLEKASLQQEAKSANDSNDTKKHSELDDDGLL